MVVVVVVNEFEESIEQSDVAVVVDSVLDFSTLVVILMMILILVVVVASDLSGVALSIVRRKMLHSMELYREVTLMMMMIHQRMIYLMHQHHS